MESQRGGVLMSDNRGRLIKNGEGKGARSYRVASAKKYKEHTEVFGASKLL